MWRFYKSVAVSAIVESWHAADRVTAAATVALFLAGVFNRKIAELAMTTWNGVSPWWSLLPIAGLALYRLLRANYERFAALDSLVARKFLREQIQTELGARLREAHKIQQRFVYSDTLPDFRTDIMEWVGKTEATLQHFGLVSDHALFSTADSGIEYPRVDHTIASDIPGLLAEPSTDQKIAYYRFRLTSFERLLREILRRQSI